MYRTPLEPCVVPVRIECTVPGTQRSDAWLEYTIPSTVTCKPEFASGVEKEKFTLIEGSCVSGASRSFITNIARLPLALSVPGPGIAFTNVMAALPARAHVRPQPCQLRVHECTDERDDATGHPRPDDEERGVHRARDDAWVDEDPRADDPAHDDHGRVERAEASGESRLGARLTGSPDVEGVGEWLSHGARRYGGGEAGSTGRSIGSRVGLFRL